MARVPKSPEFTAEQAMQQLPAWWQLQRKIVELYKQEIVLRQMIVGTLFAKPKEGTNKMDIGNGYTLVADCKINRTVDEATYKAALPALRKAKVKVDDLVQYKPSLSTKVYRQLTAEQRKIVDKVITAKPGTPSLTIRAPEQGAEESADE